MAVFLDGDVTGLFRNANEVRWFLKEEAGEPLRDPVEPTDAERAQAAFDREYPGKRAETEAREAFFPHCVKRPFGI